MENQDTLAIISLAYYDYILYKSGYKKLFLLLTREGGFGVYDYTIEPQFTDLKNDESTKNEIYTLLKEYRLSPEEFVKNHREVLLDSEQSKSALDFWEQAISKKIV
jgi:hypothetical protein